MEHIRRAEARLEEQRANMQAIRDRVNAVVSEYEALSDDGEGEGEEEEEEEGADGEEATATAGTAPHAAGGRRTRRSRTVQLAERLKRIDRMTSGIAHAIAGRNATLDEIRRSVAVLQEGAPAGRLGSVELVEEVSELRGNVGRVESALRTALQARDTMVGLSRHLMTVIQSQGQVSAEELSLLHRRLEDTRRMITESESRFIAQEQDLEMLQHDHSSLEGELVSTRMTLNRLLREKATLEEEKAVEVEALRQERQTLMARLRELENQVAAKDILLRDAMQGAGAKQNQALLQALEESKQKLQQMSAEAERVGQERRQRLRDSAAPTTAELEARAQAEEERTARVQVEVAAAVEQQKQEWEERARQTEADLRAQLEAREKALAVAKAEVEEAAAAARAEGERKVRW